MHLIVQKNGRTINEFRFTKGPVYIGRRSSNQISLPDEKISRKHAAILRTEDGKWAIEDLDSAHKTYLNDKAVYRTEIKTGDCIRITDFTIKINLDDTAETAKEADVSEPNKTDLSTETAQVADATQTATMLFSGPQLVVRKIGAEASPPIRLPAQRAVDLLQAIKTICNTASLDELVLAMLSIASRQFGAFHAWCGLKSELTGPITYHAGKNRSGQTVALSDINLSEKISESIERQQFSLYLFSRDQTQAESEKIRSAIIAPVVCADGCLGVLYIDNAIGDEHYSLDDMDYLMLLGMHAAAMMQSGQYTTDYQPTRRTRKSAKSKMLND